MLKNKLKGESGYAVKYLSTRKFYGYFIPKSNCDYFRKRKAGKKDVDNIQNNKRQTANYQGEELC